MMFKAVVADVLQQFLKPLGYAHWLKLPWSAGAWLEPAFARTGSTQSPGSIICGHAEKSKITGGDPALDGTKAIFLAQCTAQNIQRLDLTSAQRNFSGNLSNAGRCSSLCHHEDCYSSLIPPERHWAASWAANMETAPVTSLSQAEGLPARSSYSWPDRWHSRNCFGRCPNTGTVEA